MVLVGSIPFRWPLVGVIAEFLAPSHLGALTSHSLPSLRRAIQNGRALNMPKEKVEAAIKKASGQGAAV